MRPTIYSTKERLVLTTISAGREHFTHRDLLTSYDTYDYSVSYGDNFYWLAAAIFSDDANWWVLSDLNPPKDVFDYMPGDVIKLPNSLAQTNRGIPKFF